MLLLLCRKQQRWPYEQRSVCATQIRRTAASPTAGGPVGASEGSGGAQTCQGGVQTAGAPQSAVKFTRAAALWGALIIGFLILIVLLIFIAQNTVSTQVTFLVWHWNLPLGVGILFAAVAGGLLTVAVGAVRIYQLRRAAKRNLKAGL